MLAGHLAVSPLSFCVHHSCSLCCPCSQLSGLRGLRLAAQHLPEGALPAILRLSLLSRLELESSFLPLPHMGSLTALRRLKQVRLMDDSERQDALQLPAPADFGAQGGLHSLTVYTRQTWQVGWGGRLGCGLQHQNACGHA